MKVAIISDVYPPVRTSGAVQLRDLSEEMVRQGIRVTVIIPSASLEKSWLVEDMNGVEVLRLRAFKTKDVGYVRRTISEFVMPFIMLHHLRKSPFKNVRWDGVVWYSPTIFLGPLANALKRYSQCRSYLILRDIFPEWAVDMGLLRRGLPYLFFKIIERYQYSVADVIGVQTWANLPYFGCWIQHRGRRVEVLHNWLAESSNHGCSISVEKSKLAGRKIFVYAGNMGVAQGMGVLIDLAERVSVRRDIGFLFVGRGSDAQRLRDDVKSRGLDNVEFYDEIDPSEIFGLYAQCHVGIVALDSRHKTHNIPGKFLSYMQAGLPVLASINSGNDLAEMIQEAEVGRVCTDQSVDKLTCMTFELVDDIVAAGVSMSVRCDSLMKQFFSPDVAVKQIVVALKSESALR